MQKYFAQGDSRELIGHLNEFNTLWNSVTSPYEQGIGAVWSRNINYYYSNILNGDSNTSLGFDGDQGQLVRMLVPQARSLNTQFLSLTTKQKLYFDPQALSTDAATLADTRVAQALCDRITSDQKVDQKGYRLAEICSLTGASYLKVGWQLNKGKEMGFDPTDKSTVYAGGLNISVHNILDMAFEYVQEDFYEQDWVRVRTLKNRWDLVAEYPQMSEAIQQLPRAYSQGDASFFWNVPLGEDMVWIYEFFHKSTPALPLGRYTVYSTEDTVYHDDDNPYKDDKGAYIPIVEMKPEPIAGTGFGYPIFSNLLPLQEMLDHNFSAIATNNNAFAVKSIINPSGNDIGVKQIQNLKFINYKPMNTKGGGRPEVLDLNTQNTEIYNFNGTIVQNMQQIYAINSAIRGEPGAGITSGTAIATLSANAIEFAQNFSKGYVQAWELAMYYGILAYRNFAKEEEVVAISGPNDSSIAKTFKGSDLNNISRVDCSIANPLLATAAGKLEIANNLLQSGQVNFKKYLKIIEGAPLESLYDKEFDEANFVQEENDDLRKEDGDAVIAFAEDDHPFHIQEHKALLDNKEIRRNEVLVKKIRDHIFQHYQLAKNSDPLLYQMIKTGQMPPMPPPGAPMGPGGPEMMPPPPGAEMPPPDMMGPPPGPESAPMAVPPGTIANADVGGMAPMPPLLGA